jgi:uncharacterized lipoprotein YajG
MGTNMKYAWLFLALGFVVLVYGCATKQEIVIAYHPQENVTPLKEAGEIGIKVKTFDLRKDKSTRPAFDDQASTLIIVIGLKNFVSHAIESELLNRGFILGESVSIEIDLIDTKYYHVDSDGWYGSISAEITFHVSVINSKGVLVFQDLVRRQGDNFKVEAFGRFNAKLVFESAFKAGVFQLVNNPEFINSLIEANVNKP